VEEKIFTLSTPQNEPVLNYGPGSAEKTEIKARLNDMSASRIEIPLIIGGKEIRTGDLGTCVMPHDFGQVLATYHKAGPKEIQLAIEVSRKAWEDWSRLPWSARVSVFLKAAELLSDYRRATVNASTMLGQSKTVHQAEIDAACELIDFFRFNSHFVDRIYGEQPISTLGVWDRLEWRPLEGFVFAVTPFNFTSIAGNLPTAPAIMGNTVIWKPASSSVFSGYYVMKLLVDAGLPDGVINFLPSAGKVIGNEVLQSSDLGGIHFTGSTATFQHLWKTIGNNIDKYQSYPRIVGETGGKDFIMVHTSAEVDSLVCGMVRGAFEYQGQKCSAASRAYVPDNLWPEVKTRLVESIEQIKMGDPCDFRNFIGAVIDEAAFDSIGAYIDFAEQSNEAEIVIGGGRDKTKGFFIEPTVVLTSNPHFKLMEEEIFGPVLTIYVYPEKEYTETLELCDATSPYALTGAVFATDRYAILEAHKKLRHAAGNFYVNDKPTGAVVGMQPFGGSRASGTNDKAGSMLNLLRWVTPRTIKETFMAARKFAYPFMGEE
jgi:1-pyrroline-5-carboxylate dehydrogenase